LIRQSGVFVWKISSTVPKKAGPPVLGGTMIE
jgi:hypothetical protein